MKNKIYAMGHDQNLLSRISESLGTDHEVLCFGGADELFEAVVSESPDLMLLDCDFSRQEDRDMFERARKVSPHSKILIISDTATIRDAVSITKLGAANFIQKPLQIDRLIIAVKENLKGEDRRFTAFPKGIENCEWLKGTSAKIRQMLGNMEKETEKESDIIFICEQGIDATVLAEIIHWNSRGKRLLAGLACRQTGRQDLRFDAIDLSSFKKESSENYFWAMIQELVSGKETAGGECCGTLLLKNFDIVDRHFQESILKYLEKTLKKSPGDRIKIMISVGRIEDMLELDRMHLLDIFSKIHVPPLRERREDIPVILKSYLDRYCRIYGKAITAVSTDLLGTVMSYDWPGNIKELESLLEPAVMNCSSDILGMDSFPVDYRMIFRKLSYEIGETAPMSVAETGLLKEVALRFRDKTRLAGEDLAKLLDVPKDSISDIG